MTRLKPVGRDAAVKKYDTLSALMLIGLHGSKGAHLLSTRLACLITARYNWQRDELTMGQAEIARLWGVDRRTVKREVAKLKERGWLVVKRSGARGRVATYGISMETILTDAKPLWCAIGPDFEERAARLLPRGEDQESPRVVHLDFAKKAVSTTDGEWSMVLARLEAKNAAVARNWYGQLGFAGVEGPVLVLTSPSRFVARYIEAHLARELVTIAAEIFPSVRELRLETGG